MAKKHANKSDRTLLYDIQKAKTELEAATENFTYETDPLLIDMYSYRIKACQARYRYLLQRAKDESVRSSPVSIIAFYER